MSHPDYGITPVGASISSSPRECAPVSILFASATPRGISNNNGNGDGDRNNDNATESSNTAVITPSQACTTPSTSHTKKKQKRKRRSNDGRGGEEDQGAVLSYNRWGTLTRKSILGMSDDNLLVYFNTDHLEQRTTCDNPLCKRNCLHIFEDSMVRGLVAKYLVGFARKQKEVQDNIILDWYKYADGGGKANLYHVPFDAIGADHNISIDTINTIRRHRFCQDGMLAVMQVGGTRFTSIRKAANTTGVVRCHGLTGKKSNNAIGDDDARMAPLLEHFSDIQQFAEVRATRTVANIVDGVQQGQKNRGDNNEDKMYLPISMGYRPCYFRYINSIGFSAKNLPDGTIKVVTAQKLDSDGAIVHAGGDEVDPAKYIAWSTYFHIWKIKYPLLKVMKPVEDICQYCFMFANRHRYLSRHKSLPPTMPDDPSVNVCGECNDDVTVDDLIEEIMADDADGDDADSKDGSDDDDVMANDADGEVAVGIDGSDEDHANENELKKVQELYPGTAANEKDERIELMLLQSADHIKRARKQRELYQEKMKQAEDDAKNNVPHCNRTYTFVVDYGQNMELPVYNAHQPGCCYYYTPLTVNNLGVVNHAHVHQDKSVSSHLHAHVYNEAEGKKGANNVASLVVKTLVDENVIRDDEKGGELNIIFDNCAGQNKNNTVLKLVPWLIEMGYFQKVNFIFLIVGHTKNAADRHFNLLKKDYRKQNIYTMDGLFDALSASDGVTVIPTTHKDFFDYDTLFDTLYKDLKRKIKQNHIFSCEFKEGNDTKHEMILRASNLDEDKPTTHKAFKPRSGLQIEQLKTFCTENLHELENVGLNPWKIVELWKNYSEVVPEEYRTDPMYQKPMAEVADMVKDEKAKRSVFRAQLNKQKLDGKRALKEKLDGVVNLHDRVAVEII